MEKRKILIKKAFEKAKSELPKGSKNSIAIYLSLHFNERFGFSKDERTYVRYYTRLVEENSDYEIDDISLDQFSIYLGYENYTDFCEKEAFNLHSKNDGQNEDGFLEEILDTLVTIKNNFSFLLSHFAVKQNGWGVVGIMALGGLFLGNNLHFFQKNNTAQNIPDSTIYSLLQTKEASQYQDQTPKIVLITQPGQELRRVETNRKKECMYWKNDHYEPIFCDEKIPNETVIALDEEKLLLKKITFPDTLTVENALGKVWYDKSNHKLEFFTHYGIHPTNGKTLKPITKYMIETYVK